MWQCVLKAGGHREYRCAEIPIGCMLDEAGGQVKLETNCEESTKPREIRYPPSPKKQCRGRDIMSARKGKAASSHFQAFSSTLYVGARGVANLAR